MKRAALFLIVSCMVLVTACTPSNESQSDNAKDAKSTISTEASSEEASKAVSKPATETASDAATEAVSEAAEEVTEATSESSKEEATDDSPDAAKGATYLWDTKNDKYEGFTDLGNYVIDVDPYTDFDLEKALAYANKRADFVANAEKAFGCSALATHAPNGDVIIGRNLDLTVSQLPCYITHTDFGKYKQINFTYDQSNTQGVKYKDVIKEGKIDPEYYNAIPLLSTDSFNDQGLYIEGNMRDPEAYFVCLGTNPGKTRICTANILLLVTANCKTVSEAIDYITNELDMYTIGNESFASGWNICFVIGDATGEYGLIEIAHDQVKYMPYQHGQGNYYVWPTWNAFSKRGSGFGRFQYGMEHLKEAVDEESMLELMSHIMWKNEIYGVKNSYRDEDGILHFIGRDGNPTIDWRDDADRKFPVDENGKLVEKTGYEEDWNAYQKGDLSKEEGYNKHQEYLDRCNRMWLCDDDNFEALKEALDKKYTETGIYEKLDKYYAGDEDPLRDDGNIWTTALSFGVNCTQKSLTLRFWEEEETVLKFQW